MQESYVLAKGPGNAAAVGKNERSHIIALPRVTLAECRLFKINFYLVSWSELLRDALALEVLGGIEAVSERCNVLALGGIGRPL